MPTTTHKRHGVVIKRVLESDLIWDELVMESWLEQGVMRRHLPVDSVDDALDGGGDDATSAGGAGDEI
jgi:hypothetical protein